ncbi:MAG: VOC family protein [Ilumatobacter sp.]
MIRLRQVALCTDDIWREEQVIVAQLGVAAVHRDPPNVFDMRNAVFAVGDAFLEVLQPTTETAPSARFLHRRNGPGGYMVILQVDDLDAMRTVVLDHDVRIVYDQPAALHHGVEASAVHLHPADTGGAIMSFDRMDPADGWAWAGRAWQGHVHTHVVDQIVAVELASREPEALAARWAGLLDRGHLPMASGHWSIELDQGRVDVVGSGIDGPDQLTAIEMRAVDRNRVGETVTVSGTEIRFV